MQAESPGIESGKSTWFAFGLFSLVAVLAGCLAASAHSAPYRLIILNISAWVAGAVIAASVARARAGLTMAWLGVASFVLVGTFLSAGVSGVHRWVAIGPLRLNGAELVLPGALAACAGSDRASLLRLLFPLASMVILASQPDASQTAAVASANVVILITSSRPLPVRAFLALASISAVVVSALRPDPLGPVPEVEGIVLLAAHLSPVLAGLGVAAIAGSVAAPLLSARVSGAPARDAALALAVYFAVAAVAPAVGAFPVPLMGLAVSPIIGEWLGLGHARRLGAFPGRKTGARGR